MKAIRRNEIELVTVTPTLERIPACVAELVPGAKVTM
jgi:hypothetical protein